MKPVDTKVYTSLIRMEYLKVFDNFIDKFANELGYDLNSKEVAITYKDLIRHRKDAMVQGYFKYGSIFDNYTKNLRMKPFDDAKNRCNAYIKTHNKAHLVDALNFLMLTYNVKLQYVPEVLNEMDVFQSMFNLALDWGTPDAIIFYLDMYVEHKEIEYLGLAALLIIYEIQHHSYPDAFFDAEHELIPLAGYSVKDVEGLFGE